MFYNRMGCVTGIEPVSSDYKAEALPLSYTHRIYRSVEISRQARLADLFIFTHKPIAVKENLHLFRFAF